MHSATFPIFVLGHFSNILYSDTFLIQDNPFSRKKVLHPVLHLLPFLHPVFKCLLVKVWQQIDFISMIYARENPAPEDLAPGNCTSLSSNLTMGTMMLNNSYFNSTRVREEARGSMASSLSMEEMLLEVRSPPLQPPSLRIRRFPLTSRKALVRQSSWQICSGGRIWEMILILHIHTSVLKLFWGWRWIKATVPMPPIQCWTKTQAQRDVPAMIVVTTRMTR